MSNTDNDILEYILGVCLDDAADSADLADMVASYFPEFNSHIDSNDDDDDSMKEIVGQALRQAAKESTELRDALENTENVSSTVEKTQSESEEYFSNTVDDENTQDSQPEGIVEPDVQELLLIFPHIPIDVIQFIFRVKFAGVKSDAAQYLLENAEGENK